MKTRILQTIKASSLLLALALGACGGGSDPQTQSQCSQSNLSACGGSGAGTGSGNSGTGSGTTSSQSSIALSLKNTSGASVASVSPEAPGTLQAVVKDSKGSALANVAVSFVTTDKTGAFVPSSGTALTDSSGVAKLGLAAGTQAGAFTVNASASANGAAVTGSMGYTVAFPALTFSPITVTPASLSAGGTANLSVTVMSGSSAFAPAQSVSFSSPCASAGKATISSPVITVNGVASTSYTDKGCGGADTITASTSLGGASFSQTGSVTVLAATAGQIAFVSALPHNIAMKSTGGAGRQESSTVTFKVLDKNGNPVAGALVDFTLTSTVGGVSINPSSANSGADGSLVTVVAAGIVNTSVRVLATLRGTAISTVSDKLTISTGVADQNSFTVSPSVYNIECMNYNGDNFTSIRAYVADHFNNPVADGTSVSFTTEGGAVDAYCLTGLDEITNTNGTKTLLPGTPGQCKAKFTCQNPRPADGRITVLAYTQGEESFTDDPSIMNGINRYDLGESFQDLREPFRHDRAVSEADAKNVNNGLNNAISPAIGEPYIDSDGNGIWGSAGDGFYNGVLQSSPNGKTPTIHVREAFVLVFSTSQAAITALDAVPIQLDHCVDGTPFANITKTFRVAVRDINPTIFPGNTLAGNILPAGTTISFATTNGKLLGQTEFKVPNTNESSSAAWTYTLSLQSDALQNSSAPYSCLNPVAVGSLTVTVTTPLGTVTTSQPYTVND